MESKTIRHIKQVAFLFLGVVLLLFAAIVLRTFVRMVIVGKMEMKAPWIDGLFYDNPDYALTPGEEAELEQNQFGEVKVDVDWESLYPLEKTDPEQTAAQAGSEEAEASVEDRIRELEHMVGAAFRKMIPAYNSIVMTTSRLEDWIGWNIPQYSEYNPVMELQDNYFISPVSLHRSQAGVDSIRELDAFCRRQDAQLLFVLPPSKVDARKDVLISGNMDFSNQNTDFLTEQLENAGISYLDLRQAAAAQGLDTHSLFFETDHHWKPETGLWAASQIAQYLNSELDCRLETDLLAPEQYDKTVLEDWLLGSLGKKVTLSRAEPEDISILYPRYDTRLRFTVPSMDIDAVGDFSITYDRRHIEKKDWMNQDPYAAYAYCNKGLVQFENLRQADDCRVLVIKDSFANVVTPFLSQTVSRMDVLDLRIFTGSVKTFIKETEPDIVIVLYSSQLPDEIDWASRGDLYDFR